MYPIDFEDAREAYALEGVLSGLEAHIRNVKRLEEERLIEQHGKWERSWRTRLSHWLRGLADRIVLPEPPLPGAEIYRRKGR